MKLLMVATCLLITLAISAQKGFKTSISLHPLEPNGSYQIQECNNKYILNGQYFDSYYKYWLPFVAEVSLQGEILHKSILVNDTTYGLNLYDRSFCNLDSYFFTGKSSNQVIFKYELNTQLISIIDRFYFMDYDIGPSSFLYSDDFSKLYYCGRNIASDESEATVILLSRSDTVLFKHRIEGKDLIARNMRFNSQGNIVVVAEASEAWLDSTFIFIFDPHLNLVSSTSQTEFAANFSLRNGLEVDHQDNIICTGSKVTKLDSGFTVRTGAVLFDKQGKHVWTAGIGDRNNVIDDYPEWNAVIESSDKDGYVLAGASSYQTVNKDTSIKIPSIGKLSLNGDSLWYYTYSFRSGAKIKESFHDIISTNDGGYLAVGESILPSAENANLPWVQSILLKVDSLGKLDTSTVSVLNVDQDNFTLFPNPTNGIIYLKQKGENNLNIFISDCLGNIVENFISPSSNHTIILDITKYPSGIYNVIAEDKSNRKNYITRILKMN